MCHKNIIIIHISDINLQQKDVGPGSVGEWVRTLKVRVLENNFYQVNSAL
jgi:hypothetical protein